MRSSATLSSVATLQVLYEEARRGGCAAATANLRVLCEKEGQATKPKELYKEDRRGGLAAAATALPHVLGSRKGVMHVFDLSCKEC